MLHREVEEHGRERELNRAPHNERTVLYALKLTFLLISLLQIFVDVNNVLKNFICLVCMASIKIKK